MNTIYDNMVDRTIQVQNGLTLVVRAVPVAGPLCVSPIKALISIAQTIVGAAMSIFIAMPYGASCFSHWSSERKHVVQVRFPLMGVETLLYSILNTISFGVIRYPRPRLVVGLSV